MKVNLNVAACLLWVFAAANWVFAAAIKGRKTKWCVVGGKGGGRGRPSCSSSASLSALTADSSLHTTPSK